MSTIERESLLGKWNARKPMTQREIAQLVGCSRSNIAFIEAKALRKIRQAMEQAQRERQR